MSLGPIDLLFNIVLMFLWVRIWNGKSLLGRFNPYVAGVENFTQPLLELPHRRITTAHAALFAWVVLILFRGIVLPLANASHIQQAWELRMCYVAVTPEKCMPCSTWTFIAFSLLSFFTFLFQIWSLMLLFMPRYRYGSPIDRVGEFFYVLARPFSNLTPAVRPWVLLLFGGFIILSMDMTALGGAPGGATSSGSFEILLLRYSIASLAACVDVLQVVISTVFVLIIGSFIVMFVGGSLAIICQEWLQFFLGPFRRFPLQIGFLDLTPMLAVAVFAIAHWFLIGEQDMPGLLLRVYNILLGYTG